MWENEHEACSKTIRHRSIMNSHPENMIGRHAWYTDGSKTKLEIRLNEISIVTDRQAALRNYRKFKS